MKMNRTLIFARVAAMLLMLVTMSVGEVWAEHGFLSDDACGFKVYYGGGADFEIKKKSSGASTHNLGTLSTLYFKGWFVALWENTDDITGNESCKIFYRIYPKDHPSGEFISLEKNVANSFSGWNNGKQNVWCNGVENINLLAGLTVGKYEIEYYFLYNGNEYLSNNTSNYKIQFTYGYTVDELAVIDGEYSYTPSVKLLGGGLYDGNRILSVGEGNACGDGLQIKTNRQIAFKVNAGATVIVTYTPRSDNDVYRSMQMGTEYNAEGYEGGGITSTNGTLAHTFSEASTVYLAASVDLYMTKLQVVYPYVIAGNGLHNWLNEENWNTSAETNVMTYTDGVWSKTYTGVQKGTYKFKLCKNGNYVVAANTAGITFTGENTTITDDGETYHNITFTTATRGDITIRFDGSNVHVVAPAKIDYSITYNCDEAESGCPEYVASTRVLPNPLPNAPVKSGYAFAGWFTDAEKTELAVAGATLTEDVTLYAKWKTQYTVTLDNQDATTPGTTSVIVVKGSKAGIADAYGNLLAITQPQKTGFLFGGYYTAQDGAGEQVIGVDGKFILGTTYVLETKNWEYEGNVTLYAKWLDPTVSFTWTVAETVYQGQQVPFTVQTNSDATLTEGSVTVSGGSGNSLKDVKVYDNTITGTLVVTVANYDNITLRIHTDATSKYNAGDEDKVLTISTTCPSAGTEVSFLYTLAPSTLNITDRDVAAIGGTIRSKNVDVSSSAVSIDGVSYYKFNNDAVDKAYIQVKLDKALAIGDVISVNCLATSKNKTPFSLYANQSSSAIHTFGPTDSQNANVPATFNYTIPDASGLVGATTFYIGRSGSEGRLRSIFIESSAKIGSLLWEDSELGDGDVVVKKLGDANFTNVAIATSAGTISYASDAPSVASVNSSTGEVAIGSTSGRATITASVAAHGCYDAQTITYIVEVQSDCTAPTITAQPADANYEVGAEATALHVSATGTAPLTYQWYSNTTNSNENGTAIPAATSASYTPATTAKGTYYYYCVVTSETYCSIASEVATITVTKTCGEREAPTIIVADHTGTELCWQTITLKAVKQDGSSEFENGTYVWYKDDEVIAGQTQITLVVNEAGTYYVEHVYNDCPMESSNRAYVEHKDAMAQRLTPFQCYHEYKVDDQGNLVDWTYSSQMKDRHLFAVRGLNEVAGKTYEVSASLKQDADDASPADKTTEVNAMLDVVTSTTDTSVDTLMIDLNRLRSLGMTEGNELVISVAPYDCQGNPEDAQSITIYVIDEKPVLAFILPGADGEGTKTKKNLVVGGDFLTGYNKADLKTQTALDAVSGVDLPLYTALKENFYTTPVNGYAPFNILNYEPFDLVFLTDFVKTDGSSDKEAARKKVNDLGKLVDYRPLFSTKCHMSGIDNWKKVGFTANPVAPTQTQLHMNIVCYAHPMFEGMATDGTNIFTDYYEQNETVFKMISGGGFDNNKGVQGFELSAAENFITVAQTHNDAHGEVDNDDPHMLKPIVGAEDKILVASCERQTNVEARMILLSLNADATSRLTPAGIDVIVRSLNYLMETRPVKVTDCHFAFDDAAGTGVWSDPGNWAPRHSVLPTKNVNVRIEKDVIVDITNAVASTMKIMDGVTVTIPDTGALQLTNRALHLVGEYNGDLEATRAEDIFVASTSVGNGAFIHGDEAGQTGATVQMYSAANATADETGSGATVYSWQWMTTPFNDVADAQNNYYMAWMYNYSNQDHVWMQHQVLTGDPLTPFAGYCITQVGATTYTMTGTLASTADQEIPLYNGLNLIGNSWTAPINISAFKEADFEHAEATVVLFNTGLDEAGNHQTTEVHDASIEDVTTPGTYASIPINTADAINDKLSVIPSMQAFEVRTNKGENGTLHLDYDRIVRKSGNVNVQPMRAPSRAMAEASEDGIYSKLRIYVQGSHYGDYVYILRNDETTMDYDNGWDGRKYMSNNLDIPVLMVRYGTNNWQVSTQPEFVGTELAFYQGEDNVYTMGFKYDGEETLWLYDSTTDTYTEINNENIYTFTSNTTKLQKRFVIVGYNPNAPQNPGTATDVGDVSSSGSEPRKLILDDKLYIMNNGRLYDATGRLAY